VPELPEVETVRRQLEPEVVGRRIERAEVLDERWTRPEPPARTEELLAGRRIEAVDRRGKYLIVRLDDGSALVMHLRMTGNLLLRPPHSEQVADLMSAERFGAPRLWEASTAVRHLRARLELDDGSELLFIDARRFGHGVGLAAEEIEPYFASRLGVEPLSEDLTPEHLCELAAGRRAPLKSFLLDQAGIAGIGNIYADEALWRVKLHGARPTEKLTRAQGRAVLTAAAEVMDEALAQGGTSFDALYVNVNGASGYFDRSLAAYGQADRPCPRCGTPIRREPFMNRSSFSCPRCQPRPRRRF
jgi:formamidopyrimidine-DNA glycosylase